MGNGVSSRYRVTAGRFTAFSQASWPSTSKFFGKSGGYERLSTGCLQSPTSRAAETRTSDFLLRSDCAVMQWLDADLEFSPAALALQTELVLDSHADAIGGNYPGKAYFPDQLAAALKAGLARRRP